MRNLFFRLMKLCSFFLLILVSSAAFAHPGKTDYQDGHKCLRNCEDWDMHYDEYHLHDKDRNTIRVERREKSLRKPAPEKKLAREASKQEVVIVPILPTSETQTEGIRRSEPNVVVSQGYSMPVTEGRVLTFYDILLFGVAGLLLLVMVFLRRKRKKEESYSRLH